MSIDEYLDQKDPRMQAPFSVMVPRWACFQIYSNILFWHNNTKIQTEIVVLKIFGTLLTYLSINGNLWTMDEDGNPGKPSVFKLST
jgi:hypothetical protein